MNRNLDHLLEMRESIPLEVFQLDDGYQKHWGDWVPSKDFPEDMREVSGSILRHGFKAGIWLAPFAVDKKSDLAKEHPVREEEILPAKAVSCTAFRCKRFFAGSLVKLKVSVASLGMVDQE